MGDAARTTRLYNAQRIAIFIIPAIATKYYRKILLGLPLTRQVFILICQKLNLKSQVSTA